MQNQSKRTKNMNEGQKSMKKQQVNRLREFEADDDLRWYADSNYRNRVNGDYDSSDD
jgi:hypothetical protein